MSSPTEKRRKRSEEKFATLRKDELCGPPQKNYVRRIMKALIGFAKENGKRFFEINVSINVEKKMLVPKS